MTENTKLSFIGSKYFIKQINDLLWTVWDPFGFNDARSAENEYSCYATKVCEMILGGANAVMVLEYLLNAERELLQMEPNDENRTRRIAVHAIKIYQMAQVVI